MDIAIGSGGARHPRGRWRLSLGRVDDGRRRSYGRRSPRSADGTSSAMTMTTVWALSAALLLLSLLAEGSSAAFTSSTSCGRSMPRGIPEKRNYVKVVPYSSLYYKNGGGDSSDERSSGDERTTTSNSSSGRVIRPSKKKYGKARRRPSYRSQRRLTGAPATEEELARHVQSVFSDLREFGDDGDDESRGEEEEEDEDTPCILSEPEEDGGGGEVVSSLAVQHLDSCRKLDRHPSLVLNADYQPLRMLPLSIWSWQDTVKAVLSGKAVVVDVYPEVYVRAVSLDMPVPSVIALREYAATGKARPAFTRRNVFLRDGYRCQYCYDLFRTSDLSLDHVEPRCFGGRLTWENTVTCCKKCNGRKGCLRPSELHRVGMKLRSEPRCPSLFQLASEANKFVPRRVHPTWAPFLGLSAEEEEDVVDAVNNGGANEVMGGEEEKMMQKENPKKKSRRMQ